MEASKATMEATTMATEELLLEVEAVQAVYGDDCRVIHGSPLHLTVHLRPRTADDSSQQFVEVDLGITLSPQYPEKPPHIFIVDTKGLDKDRQTHLVLKVKNKAEELSSCLMLVALCEEAIEVLSNMNHPEGNCPLCLHPLVSEIMKIGSCTPFMKLMSCYHCFHSECFVRWWNWVQQDGDSETSRQTKTSNLDGKSSDVHAMVKQHRGNCPVCRKVFEDKDFEHIHDYVGVNSSGMTSVGMEMDDNEDLVLHSPEEVNRRQQFEAILKQQQEQNGIIEPPKYLSVLPGMFLPEPIGPSIISEGTSSVPVEENAERAMDIDSHNVMHKDSGNKRKTARRKTKNHYLITQLNAQSSRKQWKRRELDPSEH